MKPGRNPYESPVSPAKMPAVARRFATRLLISFACMIVWPLIGLGLSYIYKLADHPLEFCLPFGGVTIFLAPILLSIDLVSEVFAVAIIIVVWVLILIVPAVGVHWRGWNQKRMLIYQSAISLSQAVLGTIFLLDEIA